MAVLGAARHLAERGVEVELVSTRADLEDGEEVALCAALDGVARLTLVDTFGPKRLELSAEVVPILWSALGRTDVVHVHTVFTFPVAVVPMLARLRRVPVVIRPAGTLDRVCLADGPARQKAWAVRAWVRPNLALAAAVHATSDAEAAELARFCDPKHIQVIPHGVDLPSLTPRIPNARFRIGTLGRLDPIKRVERVIEAAARLSNVELAIAGDGEPAYVAELRAYADRLGIPTEWLGHLDGESKAAFWSSCDAVVFASRSESFGLAAAEAAAAACAIVTTPAVALAAELTAHSAGLVTSADPGALALALGRLRDSPSLRQELGHSARALCQAAWSWPAVAAQLEGLYQSVLGDRPA